MNTPKVINILTADVCRCLGISQEDIFWLQVENGGRFLAGWIGEEHPDHIAIMKQTPEFWAWWRQLWANRDRTMLAAIGKLTALELKQEGKAWEYYRQFHGMSIKCMTPNSVVMEGYHRMLKGITQKPVQTALKQ